MSSRIRRVLCPTYDLVFALKNLDLLLLWCKSALLLRSHMWINGEDMFASVSQQVAIKGTSFAVVDSSFQHVDKFEEKGMILLLFKVPCCS